MADPASYRPKTSDIPTKPGVYRFRDEHGRVIYVGKAKVLRNRLTSYFANPDRLTPKTRAMVFTAGSVEWTVVGSELEALQLEFVWIKEYNPRFNIVFRDDKTYPYLAVTLNEKYPRALVMRGDKRKGVKYFGPFYPAKAIRETLDTLLRVFPVRSCAPGVFKRAEASGRPCLLGYIDKCSAPCVGRISEEDHRQLADDLCTFMSGEATKFTKALTVKMQEAVAELEYEQAARYRDDISALNRVFERNAVVLDDRTEADIFGVHGDELEAAVQVFHVRDGRIRSQRGWVVEKVSDASDAEFVEQLLTQIYADHADRIPREILVPTLPEDINEVATWLSDLRGSKVSLRVAQRGDKAALAGTVKENAEQALRLHKSKRAGDITTRSLAMQELQEALGAEQALLRIECYDASHTQGTNVVASMVVFEDGLPKKSEYRKFSITGDAARDDTASMYDVIYRRFSRYLKEKVDPTAFVTGAVEDGSIGEVEKKKFSYPPSLVIVDGGPPQVAAAQKAMDDLGIDDIPVVGLAKRLEELWLPDDPFPVILPRASASLYLVQRLRDEAHRFAITFHREKRAKSMISSELDAVPGLGKAKQAALRKHFGSMKKIRAANVDELTQVPGIGEKLATVIKESLEDASRPSVNMTTGEIVD
ncbi:MULTISPECIES: excinuclease ABC subunit UvrC [Glutamicibacter]|uniref:UvrABC system protein C n=1 Tax=Glutamicibacter halophytocola TaxID=1933880 RepID=A0AA94XRT4_9MICC|nr:MULTISPECIES: excinuclease ABC subunit UvrC [Glutamicibacter]ALG29265.1 excinuclease ABC subunit C [Glutamicibacter halophytocola]MBF6673378.1 excinuclease ABC subunit UvrC [Glutamicibacter sp. FBE19]UUX57624.1 excinuclease ABC subunit UvrC [Glutamicibacter halophytocola]